MFKTIILITITLFISKFTSYALTTEQLQSKDAINALDIKDYKSYYFLKSKLKETSIYQYLEYK